MKFFPFTWFINFLFPSRCLSCRRLGPWLCEDCLTRLPRARENNLPNILAAFPYDDERIRKAIWLLKYGRIKELAESFALPLYETVIEEVAELKTFAPDGRKILIVPIPLSRQKLRRRGFNQAESLARALAAKGPEFFEFKPRLLLKIKETPAQVSLKKRQERLTNLKGAFMLASKAKVKGKTLILVDDVATTGSTIGEARHLLLKAGAKKVIGLVVAHGH